MSIADKTLVPGTLVRIAAAVHRLVAPNASLMTGPGTNSYVLGDPGVAVLDPGPDEPAHLERLAAAAPGLRLVFVTHTHPDHSRGARALAAATGASVVGLPPPADGRQDDTCVPTIHPADGEIFVLSPAIRLRAIHTPGHASNHVCYLLEEESLLFSGDQVLDGVTPVILPPDGDMRAYIDSLQRLKTCSLHAIAPGHGHVLTDPVSVIDGVIAHRARREAKVLAALNEAGRARLDELLPKVYDDVRRELLPIARLQLEAHLIKLVRDGRAALDGDCWLSCRE